jgi:hypothetical protein
MMKCLFKTKEGICMAYQIVFAGEVLEGHDFNTVKQRFAQLHRIPLAQAEGYFSGQSQIIKTESDRQAAKKIQDVYTKIGAKCRIREVLTKPKPEPARSTPPSQPILKQVVKKVGDDLRDMKTSHVSHPLTSDYSTTRILARVFAGIGWGIAGLGLLSLFGSVGVRNWIGIFGGGLVLVSGLALVVAGQLVRAVVDIAISNQEIVKLLKRQ